MFEVGDTVRCVNTDGCHGLVLHGWYTIKKEEDGWVQVSGACGWYNINHFELVKPEPQVEYQTVAMRSVTAFNKEVGKLASQGWRACGGVSISGEAVPMFAVLMERAVMCTQ